MLFIKEEGQGLVEYALIIVLIALAVILAVRLFGIDVKNLFQNIIDSTTGI